jgi:DNA-binding beta-propeller fold protein YncE
MNQNGKMKPIADLAAYEEHADSDGKGADSNPHGVFTDKAGAAFAVDAGGNTLLQISAKGTVSTVAVLPFRTVQNPFSGQNMEMQPVPTNVVRGPDGAFYVSELTGFPFPVGAARIYRIVPGSAPTVYASGFTNVIDLAFDAAGNLYVLEIDATSLRLGGPQGRLVRVPAGGGAAVVIDVPGLIMPGGIAIGPDGALYVTNLSVAPGGGQVLRIQP